MFLFEPDQPIDSLGTAPISEIRVLDWFHRGQNQTFGVPNILLSCLLQPQIIVSELGILLEQPIQLSARGRHATFAFQTGCAHFPDFDLSFLSTPEFESKIDSPLSDSSLVASTIRHFLICLARSGFFANLLNSSQSLVRLS